MYFRFPILLILIAAVIGGFFYFSLKHAANDLASVNQPKLNNGHDGEDTLEPTSGLSKDSLGVTISDEQEVLEGIQTRDLRAHLEILADDLMEGREAGSRGAKLASLYIANQFQRLGLQPVGDDDSYYQIVSFYEHKLAPSVRISFEIDSTLAPLDPDRDFIVIGTPRVAQMELVSELVFTGFGIRAPEYNYHSFEDVDVVDKVTVYLSGEPDSDNEQFFDGEKATRHSVGSQKRKLARSLGAAGTIGIMSREVLSRFDWSDFRNSLAPPRFSLTPINRDANGTYFPAVVLHPDAAARLFTGGEQTLEEISHAAALGQSVSSPMDLRVKFSVSTEERLIEDRNVLGFLEGSDRDLKSEVVVFTAHYDHEGIGTPVQGDSIYNGAADNASGVAGLIEVAAAFARLPIPPKRSLLFLAVSAEEKGLLGSEFYLNHPKFPLEQTVANFNLDIVGVGDSTGVVVYGIERSSLGAVVRKAAEVVGLKILPDDMPEERVFLRSDQYSFAEKGIPAIYPSFGVDKASFDDFQAYYHKPNDDKHLPFNYEYMRKHVQLTFLAGLWVANDQERPRWSPGDVFENAGAGTSATDQH